MMPPTSAESRGERCGSEWTLEAVPPREVVRLIGQLARHGELTLATLAVVSRAHGVDMQTVNDPDYAFGVARCSMGECPEWWKGFAKGVEETAAAFELELYGEGAP